jgi:hypothetical protein
MSLSGAFFSRTFPKLAGAALALAALLVLPGCWVSSIEPLYEENLSAPDPDLVLEPTIIGAWLHADADNDCLWTLVVTTEQKMYQLNMAPAATCKGEQKATRYEGHLLKLDDHRFLDVAPSSADVCDLCLPRHSFFLIAQGSGTLSLIPVSSEWLGKAIKERKVALAHLTLDDRVGVIASDVTLTASSKDLKAFVRKYADDKEAFNPNAGLVFKRK